MPDYVLMAKQRRDRLDRSRSLRERLAKRRDRGDGWICVNSRSSRKAAYQQAWNAMARRNAKGVYVEFRVVLVKDFMYASGRGYEAQIREVAG